MSVKKVLNLNTVVIASISVILVMNLGYFVVKLTQVLSGTEKRNYKGIHQFIKKNIPEGSTIVTDPLLYYSIMNANSDMQFLNLYDTLPSREQIHRETYNYDYLIITENLKQRAFVDVNYYLSKSSFDTIASYNVESNQFNKFINGLNLTSNTEEKGYNCVILKRKK